MVNQFLLLRKVALSGVLSPIGFWKQLMQSTGTNLLKLTLDEILVSLDFLALTGLRLFS